MRNGPFHSTLKKTDARRRPRKVLRGEVKLFRRRYLGVIEYFAAGRIVFGNHKVKRL